MRYNSPISGKERRKMKSKRPWPQVEITDKGERALRGGHPWVYAGEVLSAPDAEDGELCDVVSLKGRYLGTGFYNSRSLLRVRVISDNANDLFDEAFWSRRLNYAVDYRKKVMGEDYDCCRLIFGEADFFPGLTVDKFGDLLVAQVQSLGLDKRRDLLFPLLKGILEESGHKVRGLFERSEGALRGKEGMEERAGFYPFEGTPVPDSAVTNIVENGVHYRVNIGEGQKTGFFLDQKYNRRAAAKLADGMKVLDCFTHTGSFALNCVSGGATSVHAVDASQEALDMAAENARLNHAGDKITFEKADALKWLPQQAANKEKYDLVILDPPAFAKHRGAVNAEKGYRDINMYGMQLLNRGGYLCTASCSHFMPREGFEHAVHAASLLAGVRLKLAEARGQAPDHPILMGVPETAYLKFYIFQVV